MITEVEVRVKIDGLLCHLKHIFIVFLELL